MRRDDAFRVQRQASWEVKLKLDPAQMSQKMMLDTLAQNTVYEPDTTNLCRGARDGDTFVDVGTHVGFFTSIAASLVGTRAVWCRSNPGAQLPPVAGACGDQRLRNVNPRQRRRWRDGSHGGLWVSADNDGGHALWDVGPGFNARAA